MKSLRERKSHSYKVYGVLLLALAITVSPSFSAGRLPDGRIIEIKAQDILLSLLIILWVTGFLASKKTRVKKPPLLLPITIWLLASSLATLINLSLGNLSLTRTFFFFLKEIEFFFLYFYIASHIPHIMAARKVITFWVVLTLVSVGWLLYQTTLGLRGDYGPTALGETGVFPSGGFFLILFIYLFNLLIYYYLPGTSSNLRRIGLILLLTSPALGVFSSVSRTSFFGLIAAIACTLLFYTFKGGIARATTILLSTAILLSILLILVYYTVPDVHRFFVFPYILSIIKTTRLEDVWIPQLHEVITHPLGLFIGMGKGFFAGNSHSQYVRNLVETGIVGSVTFFFLIGTIIKQGGREFLRERHPFNVGISAGLLVSTITMLIISVPGEAFHTVRIAETYWFFTALALASHQLSKHMV